MRCQDRHGNTALLVNWMVRLRTCRRGLCSALASPALCRAGGGTSMKRLRTALLGVVARLLLTTAAPASAITYGQPDNGEHPYVGFMIFFDPTEPGWFSCSGTLLNSTVFLTAGHCTFDIGNDGEHVGHERRQRRVGHVRRHARSWQAGRRAPTTRPRKPLRRPQRVAQREPGLHQGNRLPEPGVRQLRRVPGQPRRRRRRPRRGRPGGHVRRPRAARHDR